jgi:hypothetical protein
MLNRVHDSGASSNVPSTLVDLLPTMMLDSDNAVPEVRVLKDCPNVFRISS